ncbi:MAG: DJ-1 family glyoxalase III [Candidatus Faecousia sp.]|nr:DJ-1 family glyoxalase III [Candidatus Faecousia sp.]
MVYMLLGTGFEVTEAMVPLVMMRRAGIDVCTVGLNGKTIRGSRDIEIVADIELGELDLTTLEGIILPGGLGGVASIKANQLALDAVKFAWENHKLVAAICAGPTVLAMLGITDGKRATCYPGCEEQMGSAVMVPGAAAVTDGNVITGTSAGCAIPFALQLITALKGQEAADAVAKQIVIR